MLVNCPSVFSSTCLTDDDYDHYDDHGDSKNHDNNVFVFVDGGGGDDDDGDDDDGNDDDNYDDDKDDDDKDDDQIKSLW